MGMGDKNSLSGETCGNRLWCRLLGWLAGLALFALATYLIYFYYAMSKCERISFRDNLIDLGFILFFAVIAFSLWSLFRRSLRCLWRKEYIEIDDVSLSRTHTLVIWTMAAGFINLFWIVFFRALSQRHCVLDFSTMGQHGALVFILVFVVINTVVLWWVFSFSRQFRAVTNEKMPEDLRQVLLRLPWIHLFELGGIVALYIFSLAMPYDETLNYGSMILFCLVLVRMLFLLPILWSITNEKDMDYFKYTGYGLGCRRSMPMKRWIAVAILRFLFVLIYFILIFGGFGVFVRFIYYFC